MRAYLRAVAIVIGLLATWAVLAPHVAPPDHAQLSGTERWDAAAATQQRLTGVAGREYTPAPGWRA